MIPVIHSACRCSHLLQGHWHTRTARENRCHRPPHSRPPPARALPLVKRRDLVVEPLEYSTGRQWSIKDPVSLRYWQLAEEEWFLYESLDGQTSADELRRRFNHRFAPRRLSEQQLAGFVANLHRDGLVVGDRPGQGEELFARRKRWKRDRWKRAFC